MADRERMVVRSEIGLTQGDPDLTVIIEKGRYAGVHAAYQTLVEWTVTAGKKGICREITINPYSVPAKAQFKLEIDGATKFTDEYIASPYSVPIVMAEITTSVKVSVKSSDGTAIGADGGISGGEY